MSKNPDVDTLADRIDRLCELTSSVSTFCYLVDAGRREREDYLDARLERSYQSLRTAYLRASEAISGERREELEEPVERSRAQNSAAAPRPARRRKVDASPIGRGLFDG